MSVTSCQQKIPLFHAYYNIFPVDVEPTSVQNINEAIVYTFFVLNNHMGLTQEQVLSFILQNFPQYSELMIYNAFEKLISNGVLVTLQAVCVDWCSVSDGVQCPAKKFAISRNLDKLPAYSNLIIFLIELTGGTRITTPIFNRWFIGNRNFQGSLITNTKRSAFSAICS